MNKSEKLLLKEMKEPSRETELLSSIKKSVDPLGQLHGDFKFKAEVSISIETVFINGGTGAVIAPAALPAVLQTRFPIYIFGLTDFYGGYARMSNLLPFTQPWQLFDIHVTQVPGYIFLPWADPVVFGVGDLVWLYWALGAFGIYRCYIIVHCNNVAYGTFLNSFASDLIILNSIRYSVPILQIAQLLNPLIFANQSLFGKTVTDAIDPRMYITNQVFNQQISDIPLTLPIDKSLMMGTYLNFDVQNINFLLTVQKVKPLTFH